MFLLSLLFSLGALVSAQGLPAIQQAYSPQLSSCPDSFQLVRSVTHSASQQLLGPDEDAYISARESSVLPDAWNVYLQNVLSSSNSNLPEYVSSILSSSSSFPKLGIALSGGGYRAAIFGAGVLTALDARNESSNTLGTGGLLQASSYITSLSGGSWLLSSLLQSNFPPLPSLIFGPSSSSSNSSNSDFGGWNAQFDLLSPAPSQAANIQFLESIIAEIAGKQASGFPVTITDVWARLLARHFCNGTHAESFFDDEDSTHGAGILLSGVPDLPSFANHQVPFPIITADSISPLQDENNVIPGDTVPLSNTIFEFTPFEMGSYDPTLSAFTPTKFLGTTNSSTCVTGFDQLAFIFGTSSQLFNEFNTSAEALAASPIGPLFSLLEQALPQSPSVELDLSLYPNPFSISSLPPSSSSTFLDSNQEFLGLIDGGEDGEVIPLQPLLVKARGVDTIIAIDASADTEDNFAGGLSLIASQNRTSLFPASYSFPQVPQTLTEFVSQGLTTRPTFFGCTPSSPSASSYSARFSSSHSHSFPPKHSDSDSSSDESAPLIIYLANGGPPFGQTPLTNTSTQQSAYEDAQIQGMLDQSFVIATQGFPPFISTPPSSSSPASSASSSNSSTSSNNDENDDEGGILRDPEWPACLACAVVDRTRAKQGIPRSGLCESCFGRYCWVPSS